MAGYYCLSEKTNRDEAAILHVLKRSLPEDLKGELFQHDVPTGLDSFLEKIVNVDIQLQQWKKVRGVHPKPTVTFSVPCLNLAPAVGQSITHNSYSPERVITKDLSVAR